MKTTLNQIKSFDPCNEVWKKLLRSLGKTKADDEPLSIITVLESNSLDDAIWCLRTVVNHDKEIRLYGVWCARKTQQLTEAGCSARVWEKAAARDALLSSVRIPAGIAAWGVAGITADIAVGVAGWIAVGIATWFAVGIKARNTSWAAAWAVTSAIGGAVGGVLVGVTKGASAGHEAGSMIWATASIALWVVAAIAADFADEDVDVDVAASEASKRAADVMASEVLIRTEVKVAKENQLRKVCFEIKKLEKRTA